VLLTFGIELASALRVEQQRVVAVLLPARGVAAEIAEPDDWLQFASPDRAIGCDGVWQSHFATWVPRRRLQAEQLATQAMQRAAAAFTETQHRRMDRESAELHGWIGLRADDICGAPVLRTADLFGHAPDVPAWNSMPAPLDRLAAYAADAANPPVRRREANTVAALFQRRGEARERRATLLPPRLWPIGMLMLVPNELATASRDAARA
jgi:hypothetical protein